ncbi:MAG: DUF2147 domain-containing protein [Sphingomonadaceae bacterium]|nr:DUF2147 domain-containing protein [Sphingomonadaceae bacterium]
MWKSVAALAACALAAPAMAAIPVSGKWLTAERDSVIEIGVCGGTLCGHVARILKGPPGGKPAVDSNNPDPALRARPIRGLTILSGFTSDGEAWEGRIYDPKSGKTYRSKLARNPDGTLKVQGCIGPFCRTMTWTAVN